MELRHEYGYVDDNTIEFIIESPKHGEFKVLIDAEDLERVSHHRWNVQLTSGKSCYICTIILHPDGGWRKCNHNMPNGPHRRRRRKLLYLHVLVNETPKGLVTDHINGDVYDNRKCNLRSATHRENGQNRGKSSNNTSGFKGVRKINKRWQARSPTCVFYGAKEHIGYYATKEEAAAAHDHVVVKHVPKDKITERMLNFPEKLEEYLAEI